MKAIEIEIDGSRNENLLFRPLQKTIRGTFDLNRISEPMARLKSAEFPIPIPGQRLGVDQDGCGYLVEPLHDEEHAPLRKKIEKEGMKLEPALVEFEDIHQPSWLFWIKRAVESGLAKITKDSSGNKLPNWYW